MTEWIRFISFSEKKKKFFEKKKIIKQSLAGESGQDGNIDDGVEIYVDLYKYLKIGDWNAAEKFLNCRPHAITAKITDRGYTALHVAAETRHVHIVEELVKRMSKEDLEIKDSLGCTALAIAAEIGNKRMAECMLQKNVNLVSIPTNCGMIPVLLALRNGNLNLAKELYLNTPLEIFVSGTGTMGAGVVIQAIYNNALGKN